MGRKPTRLIRIRALPNWNGTRMVKKVTKTKQRTNAINTREENILGKARKSGWIGKSAQKYVRASAQLCEIASPHRHCSTFSSSSERACHDRTRQIASLRDVSMNGPVTNEETRLTSWFVLPLFAIHHVLSKVAIAGSSFVLLLPAVFLQFWLQSGFRSICWGFFSVWKQHDEFQSLLAP